MHVNFVQSLVCLAFAASAAATAITIPQVDDNVDKGVARGDAGPTSGTTTLDSWDYPYYDCEGSVMCGATPIKVCDIAVNQKLHRTNDTYYGPDMAKSGACNGLVPKFGCGIFVQGEHCVRTGEEIWDDYQNIRYISGCSKCGSMHWAEGCMTTIDYISWCDSDRVEH